MISRLRKAVSIAAGAMLISASFMAISATPAQATPSDSSPDCLVINSNDELISSVSCSGDLVIPARVKTIKQRAFVGFDGQISFEANSQLTSVESSAFIMTSKLRGITFPESLVDAATSAVWTYDMRYVYLSTTSANIAYAMLSATTTGKIIVPRRESRRPVPTATSGWIYINPYQIDCSALNGDRDFIQDDFVPLELHNCKDPRNINEVNPPSTIAYVLYRGLNESVTLASIDGSKSATVRLLTNPSSVGKIASVIQPIDGGAFSTDVFGDAMPAPVGTAITCQLSSTSAPLPLGVTLTPDCKFQTNDTATMTTGSQTVSINWVAHAGVANSFDVAQTQDAPVSDWDSSGSLQVRLALIKTAELSPAALYQNLLAAAIVSGSTSNWNAALDAYRAIPSGQVPAGPLDPGMVATLATEQFEQGSGSEVAATAAISNFAAAAATGSTYLGHLQSRVSVRAAANSVAAFESNGLRAQVVKTQILDLPNSPERSALLARFNSAANLIFHSSSSQTGDTATLVYQNPYRAETFTVPSGVTRIHLNMTGAQGSQGGASSGIRPDRGGFVGSVSGDLAVTTGQILTIGVGEAASDAPSECLPGQETVAADSRIARGGSNPLGGYAGGNGGTPGTGLCGGYGGAGGAATVVYIGTNSSLNSIGTIVAGGAAGSTGSSAQMVGKIGLSSAVSRADAALTNGESPWSMYRWVWPEFPDDPWFGGSPIVGGALAGGGGGAVGGATGFFDYNVFCGRLDYCATASSPGVNATSGLAGLSATYIPYNFADGLNANGRVTISYVIPPPSSDPAGSNPSRPTDGSTGSPSTTATPPPAPPGAPTGLLVSPIWRGANVSWSAPAKDGGSPITQYRVTTGSGASCVTAKLTCRLTGLDRGQKIVLSITATNAVGVGPPTAYSGPSVFTPLSLNLWQVRSLKTLNRAQLASLKSMLIQDSGVFELEVRLVKNSSALSRRLRSIMLAREVIALKAQLAMVGILAKVRVNPMLIDSTNQVGLQAKRPSLVLVAHKP